MHHATVSRVSVTFTFHSARLNDRWNLQADDHGVRRQSVLVDVVPQRAEQSLWVVCRVHDDIAQLDHLHILQTLLVFFSLNIIARGCLCYLKQWYDKRSRPDQDPTGPDAAAVASRRLS